MEDLGAQKHGPWHPIDHLACQLEDVIVHPILDVECVLGETESGILPLRLSRREDPLQPGKRSGPHPESRKRLTHQAIRRRSELLGPAENLESRGVPPLVQQDGPDLEQRAADIAGRGPPAPRAGVLSRAHAVV
jgi:hypothetical protein